MSLAHKLDSEEDATAPFTRSQRHAILLLPASLIMSALHVWDGLNSQAELPGMVWLSLGIATLIVSVYGIQWLSKAEKRDEREVLIELKSLRVGYVILIVGNILFLPLAAIQIGDAVAALVFFSWATQSASVLFYSRRSV